MGDSVMDTADVEQLLLRKCLRVSPEEAFDAWTVRNRMRCLLPTFEGVVGEIDNQYVFDVEVDARVGGRFFVFLNFVGEPGLHEGQYRVIDRPHRLVFTWWSPVLEDLETLVTIGFESRGGEVELVLTHEGLPSRELRALHERGWARVLAHASGTLEQIREEESEL